jgi:cbb3-type cytochrome oxidase subunit 1
MRNIDSKLILVGIIYFLLATIQGQFMAITADYRYFPMHAHMGLVGGVLMILYGLIYRAYPETQQDALVKFHFWLANIGSPIFFAGIGISIAGGTRNVGHAGSIIVIVALMIFALLFFRTHGSSQYR